MLAGPQPGAGVGAVRDSFTSAHNREMARYPQRMMLLLVDFDGQEERREQVLEKVDPGLHERVFVLGSLDEPEDLREELGSFEAIGGAIGQHCLGRSSQVWEHPLLAHNKPELVRLTQKVRPFLFP